MRQGYLRMIGAPCECTRGWCLHRPDQPLALGADLPIGQWSICPLGELRNPLLLATLDLDAYAQISPLHAWPDTYAAGVVDCLVALRLERTVEQRRQLEADQ